MACVALTSLVATVELEFLKPSRRVFVSLNDRPPIISSLLANLSSLQTFLQEESRVDDGGALRDLEIEIRDFALKAEDDIELQLSNILLLAQHGEYQEKASPELHQTLGEAAKRAKELFKIVITRQKESCVSEVVKASFALTILVRNFQHYFLQHFESLWPEDETKMKNILTAFQALYSLISYLWEESGGGEEEVRHRAAIKKSETKIINFALEAVDNIEMQLSNCLLAKDIGFEEVLQTMEDAAEIVNELVMSSKSENECENENEIEIACVALSSLMGRFEDFLYDEVTRKSFLEKISSLQAFLRKESSGGGGGGGPAIKDLETKIKHFALKAKDDVQIQQNNFLQAKDTEYEEKVSQELHQTMQEAAERAAELLKIIDEEVDEANETRPSNTTWLKHAAASNSANVEPDGSSSHGFLKPDDEEARIMVGRHHDCAVMKDKLFSSRFGPLKIISIVGMMGIGKTTLARKLYEDPSVASHFDVRAWVTIPQDYNIFRILSQLLQSITPAEPNVIIKKESTPYELENQVRECLRYRRYLIVFDNILSDQVVTDFKQIVTTEEGGSCILLTTTQFNQYWSHHMTLLDSKESWELFCNILPIEEHLAPKFEKIRNRVVEKCDGLPQLIVQVANRLSGCNKIQQEWEKIEKELESLGILDRNAITVSYNMLPHHLKVCFLYFGVFPKRKIVLVKILIRLWIAEGFVMPLNLNELEDEAYEYLQVLIGRSLVLIEDQSCNGKIKSCRMHSALHTFCVGEAQKEGILCAVNTQQHSGLSLKVFANCCRWLSLYSHSFDYYVLFGTNIPRSIFFFHENLEMYVPPKLLRVLAFDTSISLQRVPLLKLGDSIFLRYLSLTQWFEDLDDVVSSNPNLQTLVVSGNGAPMVHLSSNIWEAPWLRHLELGNSYTVDPPSMVKENLKSLSCVMRPLHCKKEVYDKIPNIKKLKIFLKDDVEPSHTRGSCSSPIILDNFNHLKGLEKLSISVSIGCNAALPEHCMYLSGLKKLKLSGTNISERDLNVIAMLPELMVLKLENAFHGTVWNAVARGGFDQLIFLLLEVKELEQWVVGRNHYPVLRHLVLRSCNCLEQMPKRFSRIFSLRSIELEGCRSSLVASAKQLQRKKKFNNLKIKILDPKYDEPQNTHAEVSM